MDRVYARDTPEEPLAIDGFSLLHAAYGTLAAWVLGFASLGAGTVISIVALVAIAWEVAERALGARVGRLFGIENYEGDSALNSVADVVVAVGFAVVGTYAEDPVPLVVGLALLALGAGWTIQRKKRLDAQ